MTRKTSTLLSYALLSFKLLISAPVKGFISPASTCRLYTPKLPVPNEDDAIRRSNYEPIFSVKPNHGPELV